ncbi:MAG: phosphoribosylglycinamide formyltransferase [Candidatus Marinimicrobia bacterium]|nr:phosphoribosylglycinamide formyltransferase [Candidatus Neomarinimicrobiota bacterium]
MKHLAVFVSGGGSNFRAIHQKILAGEIDGRIELVVASKADCGAVDYARAQDIPVYIFPAADQSSSDLLERLQEASADYILLAGYLKLVPLVVVRAFPRRMVNIHPALLPDFGGRGYYGLRVHAAVIEAGCEESGVTVHFVDEIYDHGPIIAQSRVAVLPDDTPETLAARVLEQEHRLYPGVVASLCAGEYDE